MPDFKSYYKAIVISRRSRQGLVGKKGSTAKSVFENLMQCLEHRRRETEGRCIKASQNGLQPGSY